MREFKIIVGEYYIVNLMVIWLVLDVYGENVRIVVFIDFLEFGWVMVICIGVMMVGSIVIIKKEGDEVKRGDELGYFKFGGLMLVVLFESGKMVFDDDLVDNLNIVLEILVSFIYYFCFIIIVNKIRFVLVCWLVMFFLNCNGFLICVRMMFKLLRWISRMLSVGFKGRLWRRV